MRFEQVILKFQRTYLRREGNFLWVSTNESACY